MDGIKAVTQDQRPRLQMKLERLAEVIDQIHGEYSEIDRAINRMNAKPPQVEEAEKPTGEREGFLGDLDYQINKLQRLKNSMAETREHLLELI